MDSTEMKNFNDLDSEQQNDVKVIISRIFQNSNVPFGQQENVYDFLKTWNPKIILRNKTVSSFSKEASRTIDQMIIERTIIK